MAIFAGVKSLRNQQRTRSIYAEILLLLLHLYSHHRHLPGQRY